MKRVDYSSFGDFNGFQRNSISWSFNFSHIHVSWKKKLLYISWLCITGLMKSKITVQTDQAKQALLFSVVLVLTVCSDSKVESTLPSQRAMSGLVTDTCQLNTDDNIWLFLAAARTLWSCMALHLEHVFTRVCSFVVWSLIVIIMAVVTLHVKIAKHLRAIDSKCIVLKTQAGNSPWSFVQLWIFYFHRLNKTDRNERLHHWSGIFTCAVCQSHHVHAALS